MLVRPAKSNWHVVNSVVERNVDVRTSVKTMSKFDNNDDDYQESDAEVDNEETIDMIDRIMFKNYICS